MQKKKVNSCIKNTCCIGPVKFKEEVDKYAKIGKEGIMMNLSKKNEKEEDKLNDDFVLTYDETKL